MKKQKQKHYSNTGHIYRMNSWFHARPISDRRDTSEDLHIDYCRAIGQYRWVADWLGFSHSIVLVELDRIRVRDYVRSSRYFHSQQEDVRSYSSACRRVGPDPTVSEAAFPRCSLGWTSLPSAGLSVRLHSVSPAGHQQLACRRLARSKHEPSRHGHVEWHRATAVISDRIAREEDGFVGTDATGCPYEETLLRHLSIDWDISRISDLSLGKTTSFVFVEKKSSDNSPLDDVNE